MPTNPDLSRNGPAIPGSELGSVASGRGASMIGIEDAAARFSADNVEGALATTLINSDLLKVVATPAAQDSNAIQVVCAVKTMFDVASAVARQVLVRSIAVTDDQGTLGTGTPSVGTVKKNHSPSAGHSEQWMETTSGGLFNFVVVNDEAEDTLVEVFAEGCRPLLFKLTFTA
jgi:hypothetical protein